LNPIRRRVALCSAFPALLLAPLALWHAAEPPLVLILSDQSNMAGYGKAAELSDEWRTPPPNVTLIHWVCTLALAPAASARRSRWFMPTTDELNAQWPVEKLRG